MQEQFLIQDDRDEQYVREHMKEFEEQERKFGELSDAYLEEIKKEFGI